MAKKQVTNMKYLSPEEHPGWVRITFDDGSGYTTHIDRAELDGADWLKAGNVIAEPTE